MNTGGTDRRDVTAHHTLDDTEVEIIADLAAGAPDVTMGDLERYRANHSHALQARTASTKEEDK